MSAKKADNGHFAFFTLEQSRSFCDFIQSEKNFQKSVDKKGKAWYNSQAVAERETSRGKQRSLKIEQQEIKYKAIAR